MEFLHLLPSLTLWNGVGPTSYLPSALAFYRALRVYPSPVELIMIYQKTVPQPIFNVSAPVALFLYALLI